ncbi:MAG: ABC transporter ATP-binding protein, partial [Planctomycetia bacterium]|nr:ABC transporter ATP-binding protein [Planctomycetia bacterium]
MSQLARYLGRIPLAGRLFRCGDSRTDPTLPSAVIGSREPVLTATELVRSFGTGEQRGYALKGVSIELHPGELNLLMGPSGSGKSTLLAILSGLLRPDTGTVSALGKDVWNLTDREMEQFRLRHCGYIFQGANLFPALSAREQLEIVLKWGEGCSSREARQRVDHILEQLGISNKAHLRPAQLSGGEKQRVAIGRALVKNPKLIFADEPTSALDWENGQQVMKLLTEAARERGAMVLVVTHDPRLTPFADRVFDLDDGRLQIEGQP